VDECSSIIGLTCKLISQCKQGRREGIPRGEDVITECGGSGDA